MSTFPAANAISTAANQGAAKTLFEDFLASTKQLLGGSIISTLTLATDTITPTGGVHQVDTEGGAGTDDLKNIALTNIPDGRLLILSSVSASRSIRVWHSAGGSGQILLNSGNHFQLGDPSHCIIFQRRNTSWQELFRVPSADLAPILTKTANYTVTYADRGRHIVGVSGSWTLSLPDTVLAGVGFESSFENRGAGIITIDPAGTDLVDEQSTIKIQQYETWHGYSDGAGRWITKSRRRERPPSGYLYGMVLQNDLTDATNDLRITAGECASDDMNAEDRVLLKTTAMHIKQLDVAWATGSGPAGGRISGSIADGTWHVFAFRDGTDGSTQIGMDQSLTPTLPNSGTHKRLIGSILRESGAIVAFTQWNDEFWRVTPSLDINRNTPGTSANTETLSVPTGVAVEAILNAGVVSNADGHAYFSALDATDSSSSLTAAPGASVAFSSSGVGAGFTQLRVRTNTSRQIRVRTTTGGAGVTTKGSTLGWVHPRGRFT